MHQVSPLVPPPGGTYCKGVASPRPSAKSLKAPVEKHAKPLLIPNVEATTNVIELMKLLNEIMFNLRNTEASPLRNYYDTVLPLNS